MRTTCRPPPWGRVCAVTQRGHRASRDHYPASRTCPHMTCVLAAPLPSVPSGKTPSVDVLHPVLGRHDRQRPAAEGVGHVLVQYQADLLDGGLPPRRGRWWSAGLQAHGDLTALPAHPGRRRRSPRRPGPCRSLPRHRRRRRFRAADPAAPRRRRPAATGPRPGADVLACVVSSTEGAPRCARPGVCTRW